MGKTAVETFPSAFNTSDLRSVAIFLSVGLLPRKICPRQPGRARTGLAMALSTSRGRESRVRQFTGAVSSNGRGGTSSNARNWICPVTGRAKST